MTKQVISKRTNVLLKAINVVRQGTGWEQSDGPGSRESSMLDKQAAAPSTRLRKGTAYAGVTTGASLYPAVRQDEAPQCLYLCAMFG